MRPVGLMVCFFLAVSSITAIAGNKSRKKTGIAKSKTFRTLGELEGFLAKKESFAILEQVDANNKPMAKRSWRSAKSANDIYYFKHWLGTFKIHCFRNSRKDVYGRRYLPKLGLVTVPILTTKPVVFLEDSVDHELVEQHSQEPVKK